MAKRGENIYKRKDGRWEGRYIKGYGADKKIRYGYIYGKAYRDVKQKLYKMKANDIAAAEMISQNFAYYCEEWLLLRRNQVKESTYVHYMRIVRHHLLPAFGLIQPEKISTVMIEEFSNHLLKQEGLATKTVKDMLVVLHAILQYIHKKVPATMKEIEIVYPRERKKELRVLTQSEQTQLIEYLLQDMDYVKFGILVAMFTGIRIGELCALRWRDISIETQTLRVAYTVQRLSSENEKDNKKTKIVMTEPKSESSKRIIPLNKFLISLCKRMQLHNRDAFILTGNDRLMEPRTLQYRLARYTAQIGLKDVHFHVLRHSFATRCIEVGFDIKSLSDILGHSSVQVTLNRYVHSSIEHKRVNMEKLTF